MRHIMKNLKILVARVLQCNGGWERLSVGRVAKLYEDVEIREAGDMRMAW